MKYLLIVFSIFSCLLTSSLTAGSLSGEVQEDETFNLISNVNIYLIEKSDAVKSDKQGKYEFKDLEDGRYHIVASHVGYQKTDTLVVDVSGDTKYNIILKSQPWILNEVVVTGTRTPHLLKDVPVQTEIVTQEDIERTGATTVDEALGFSTGININEDLSGQGATIRGVEKDRVLILVDGERAVGRVNGSLDLSQFALNNVQKIEIVKGTGSTLYGSEAMGGVINIITKNNIVHEFKSDLSFEYGRYNQIQPNFNLSYGNGKTNFIFGSQFYHTDGFDLIDSTYHTNGIEDIDRLNLSSKVKHKLSSKWSTTVSGRYMYETKDWIESEAKVLNIYDTVDVPYDDEEINKRYESSLSFDYLSGDKYSMKLRLFGTIYDHNWNKYSQSDGEWLDTSDTKDIFVEAAYTSNYVIGDNHVATYGLEYNVQDLESTELINTKQSDKSYAGYLQYEYQPIKKLSLIMGGRYDHHSSFGGHINPSFNIMYQPVEGIKFRQFVGRGYRAPSIKEQYFVFDHTAAGYIVYGGYAVDPETFDGTEFDDLEQENSINTSLSVEMSYGTIGLHRLTYFYNHLDNLIDFKLIDFGDGYWRGRYVYQNIESAFTEGIEWESKIRFSKNFDLAFSYNYLTTKDLSNGEELRNRPKHTFKFFITNYFEKIGVGGTLYGDFHSKKVWVPRSSTGGNEEVDTTITEVVTGPQYAPQRFRLNTNIYKKFKNGLEIYVRLENIFNSVKPEYGYWPEFEFYTGIKYRF